MLTVLVPVVKIEEREPEIALAPQEQRLEQRVWNVCIRPTFEEAVDNAAGEGEIGFGPPQRCQSGVFVSRHEKAGAGIEAAAFERGEAAGRQALSTVHEERHSPR